MRPICCNHGCDKLVCCSIGKISDPNPRWRPVCGHCQQASYGKRPYRDGVTPFVLGGMSKHSANLAKYLTLTGVEVALVHCVASDVDIPSDEKLNNYLFGGSQKLYKIICLKFPSMAKFTGHYLKERMIQKKK